MHQETIEHVRHIRSRVAAGRAAIADLKVQLANNKDERVSTLLRQSSYWFDDVEMQLGWLDKEQSPPRTLAQESWLVGMTEFCLRQFAEPQLKGLKDLVAKYGPAVQFIG